MKISVYIPSYNQMAYLAEAIESVLAQTLRPAQIIIIDDCSNDGSREIIEGYMSRHPGLIRAIYHEKNLGIAQTRTDALKAATGDLVTYVDGDDRFLPNKLETEMKALRSSNAQIAYSNVYTIDDRGNRTGLWHDGTEPPPPSGRVFEQVFSRRFVPNNTAIFRNELVFRSALDAVGFYDESLELYEDWDMKIRLTARFPVVYTGEPLVEYRIHGRGLHARPARDHYNALASIYNKNLSLLRSLPERDAGRIKARLESMLAMARARTAIADKQLFLCLKELLRGVALDPWNRRMYRSLLKWMFPG
jgi:glycosyltransferase involved in cell wall biosynthesis